MLWMKGGDAGRSAYLHSTGTVLFCFKFFTHIAYRVPVRSRKSMYRKVICTGSAIWLVGLATTGVEACLVLQVEGGLGAARCGAVTAPLTPTASSNGMHVP